MNGLISDNQPKEALIYQQQSVRIVVKKMADAAAIDLLKRTVYGTNGIQYQHTGHEAKIHQLANPFFFHLFSNKELIGIYCLDERKINVSGDSIISGFYGRYLSITETQQGKGYGRLLKVEAVRYVETHVATSCIFYSYIEEKNARSLRISEREGFTSITTLRTFVFRRYSPKLDSRFTRLPNSDKATLLTKLRRFYETYSLTTFAYISYQNNYFVLKEGDEIIAGVQANPVCWKFSAMPGLSGWVMMNMLPLSSVTRRFFDPANYQFVTLEGIYLKEGREDVFSVLLESVLAHVNCHSALLQIDTKDPLNKLLTDSKRMGPLSGFQKNITTHVMVKTSSDEPVLINPDAPVYVSSFDFS
ncbi:GNAT family N-acetyltransferase [Spirosoma validum]|uniref:GNAT family N-acetyltransferase n=1 Tax=Spirosoma validum TaxID=2771355 RepID=A0A927AYL2_9BACT|nr:GNAT family protein [Spirosoma validum]MBD2752146.1 GNAT family N-acetyltransferase [Spirosoma validum]